MERTETWGSWCWVREEHPQHLPAHSATVSTPRSHHFVPSRPSLSVWLPVGAHEVPSLPPPILNVLGLLLSGDSSPMEQRAAHLGSPCTGFMDNPELQEGLFRRPWGSGCCSAPVWRYRYSSVARGKQTLWLSSRGGDVITEECVTENPDSWGRGGLREWGLSG